MKVTSTDLIVFFFRSKLVSVKHAGIVWWAFSVYHLSNLQNGLGDVFAFSLAKVLPLWEGASKWIREAILSRGSLVQSLAFEQWVLVLVLEQRSLLQSLALELG